MFNLIKTITMKKLLVLSLALSALFSCDRDDAEQTDLMISARAGVTGINSKAPVESDQADKLPLNDLIIFFARASDAPSADWSTVTGPQATEEGFVPAIIRGNLIGRHDASKKGKINFEESQYYNADQTKRSWFISYYPEDDDGYGNDLKTKGTLVWTINGKKDIMFSLVVSGDKIANKTTPLPFTLSHKLTWLEFRIESDGETDNDGDDIVANEAWGDITSIQIKDVSNLYTLTLPSTVTFSGSTNVSSWDRNDNDPTPQALTISHVFFSRALV